MILAIFGCTEEFGQLEGNADTGSRGTSTADVYIREPSVDLGQVFSTDSSEVVVCVVNDSCMPVALGSLHLSCGCLSSDFERTTIEPNESYSFVVSIPYPDIGKAWRTGTIEIESQEDTEREFDIRYEVIQAINLIPEVERIGVHSKIEDGKSVDVCFQVSGVEESLELDAPLRFDPLISNGLSLNYSMDELVELNPGTPLRLHAEIPEGFFGSFVDRLGIIAKANGHEYQIRVGVSGIVTE